MKTSCVTHIMNYYFQFQYMSVKMFSTIDKKIRKNLLLIKEKQQPNFTVTA